MPVPHTHARGWGQGTGVLVQSRANGAGFAEPKASAIDTRAPSLQPVATVPSSLPRWRPRPAVSQAGSSPSLAPRDSSSSGAASSSEVESPTSAARRRQYTQQTPGHRPVVTAAWVYPASPVSQLRAVQEQLSLVRHDKGDTERKRQEAEREAQTEAVPEFRQAAAHDAARCRGLISAFGRLENHLVSIIHQMTCTPVKPSKHSSRSPPSLSSGRIQRFTECIPQDPVFGGTYSGLQHNGSPVFFKGGEKYILTSLGTKRFVLETRAKKKLDMSPQKSTASKDTQTQCAASPRALTPRRVSNTEPQKPALSAAAPKSPVSAPLCPPAPAPAPAPAPSQPPLDDPLFGGQFKGQYYQGSPIYVNKRNGAYIVVGGEQVFGKPEDGPDPDPIFGGRLSRRFHNNQKPIYVTKWRGEYYISDTQQKVILLPDSPDNVEPYFHGVFSGQWNTASGNPIYKTERGGCYWVTAFGTQQWVREDPAEDPDSLFGGRLTGNRHSDGKPIYQTKWGNLWLSTPDPADPDPAFGGRFSGKFCANGKPQYIGLRNGLYWVDDFGKRRYAKKEEPEVSKAAETDKWGGRWSGMFHTNGAAIYTGSRGGRYYTMACGRRRYLKQAKSANEFSESESGGESDYEDAEGDYTGEKLNGRPIFEGPNGGRYTRSKNGTRVYHNQSQKAAATRSTGAGASRHNVSSTSYYSPPSVARRQTADPVDPHYDGVFCGYHTNGQPMFQGSRGGVYYYSRTGWSNRNYVSNSSSSEYNYKDENSKTHVSSYSSSYSNDYTSSRCSSTPREYITGPRGGVYYINGNGNKTYKKR